MNNGQTGNECSADIGNPSTTTNAHNKSVVEEGNCMRIK